MIKKELIILNKKFTFKDKWILISQKEKYPIIIMLIALFISILLANYNSGILVIVILLIIFNNIKFLFYKFYTVKLNWSGNNSIIREKFFLKFKFEKEKFILQTFEVFLESKTGYKRKNGVIFFKTLNSGVLVLTSFKGMTLKKEELKELNFLIGAHYVKPAPRTPDGAEMFSVPTKSVKQSYFIIDVAFCC